MQLFPSESQQNLKRSRRQWIQSSFGHICSIIDISISDYTKPRSRMSISLWGPLSPDSPSAEVVEAPDSSNPAPRHPAIQSSKRRFLLMQPQTKQLIGIGAIRHH